MWCAQVLSESATRSSDAQLNLPVAFVSSAGLQATCVSFYDDSGGCWEVELPGNHRGLVSYGVGWQSLVAAKQLQPSQAICITALNPSQLIVTRLTDAQSSAVAACHQKQLVFQVRHVDL